MTLLADKVHSAGRDKSVRAEGANKTRSAGSPVEPKPEDLQRWLEADGRKKKSSVLKVKYEDDVLSLLSDGIEIKDIANIVQKSVTTIYIRYANAFNKILKSSQLPREVVWMVLRPPPHGKKGAPSQGPFSSHGNRPLAANGLFEWVSAKNRVKEAQRDAKDDDPFYDVRAWMVAREKRDRFQCPHSIQMLHLALCLRFEGRSIWSGGLGELRELLGLPPGKYSSISIFQDKIIEPIGQDLDRWCGCKIIFEKSFQRGSYCIDISFSFDK